MPTGYTAGLYDGEQSLRDYLMHIGRGMGFAILQRDDDQSEPVKMPKRDDYYARMLAEAYDELSAAEGLTDAEAVERARREHDAREKSKAESREKKAAIRARYEAMIEQVEAWQPAPLIAATQTKAFALEQLRESIDFDCSTSYVAPSEFPEKTPDEWRAEFIEKAADRVARYEEEAAKERQRNDERAAHIRAFLDSLPAEVQS